MKTFVISFILTMMPIVAYAVGGNEIWGMTCHPNWKPPFVVAVNLSTEQLAWRGFNGETKGGPIVWQRFEFHGITVIAKGADINIKAHFNPAGGSFTFMGGSEQKIRCGPSMSTESDQIEP